MHIQNPTKIHRSYSRSDFGTMTPSEPQKWRNHLGGEDGGGDKNAFHNMHSITSYSNNKI